MEENFITQEERDNLKEKLKYLVDVKRKEITDQLKVARSFGDLSENEEYHTARDRQGALEAQISEIETELKTSLIVDEKRAKEKVITVSTVDVEVIGEGKKTYSIGKDGNGIVISSTSPIAKALIGKKVGDVVVANIPKGDTKMKILNIS